MPVKHPKPAIIHSKENIQLLERIPLEKIYKTSDSE